jgi:pilus assembly protein CpaC
MSSFTMKVARACGAVVALCALLTAVSAGADDHQKIRIPVGHSEVVTSADEVHTVAIAEPKIADAAVGSQRTVIVSGKAVGTTTLVVYGEGGRYTMFDVDVYAPGAEKQVVLHVRVAEATKDAIKELGFDFLANGWKNGVALGGAVLTGGVSGPGVTPPLSKPLGPSQQLGIEPNTSGQFGFTNKFGDLHFETAWRALETNGQIRLLANPTLVASSGDSASFLSGGEIPIPIAQTQTNDNVVITIIWKEYGVKVHFKPTVHDNGSITLDVAPEVSELDYQNALRLANFVVPALLTRKTNTTVDLQPGQNLVISGLKQTETNRTVRKVPILGDIPLVGFFFTASRVEKVEKDLLVVVTPEIQEGGSSTMPKLPSDEPNTPNK